MTVIHNGIVPGFTSVCRPNVFINTAFNYCPTGKNYESFANSFSCGAYFFSNLLIVSGSERVANLVYSIDPDIMINVGNRISGILVNVRGNICRSGRGIDLIGGRTDNGYLFHV